MSVKLFGIEIQISYIFFASLIIFISADRTGIFVPIIISVFIHELSHTLFIMLFKCKIVKLSFRIGIMGIDYHDTMNKGQKIISLISGPLSNLFLFFLGFLLNNDIFCAVNILLFIYNLLPVNGLDGGEIIKTLLSVFLEEKSIKITMRIIGISIIAILIFVFYLMYSLGNINYSLILFLVYLVISLK